MATSVADEGPGFVRDSMGGEDLETASVRSIRSAAPSYSRCQRDRKRSPLLPTAVYPGH